MNTLLKQRRALEFGPHEEPWHFMPEHLRLDALAGEALTYGAEALRLAPRLAGWLRHAQLDLDIWRDIHVLRLPAGATLRGHGHAHGGVLALIAGSLRVASRVPVGELGSRGVELLSPGEVTTFGPRGHHAVYALTESVVVESFSPRLTERGCHDYLLDAR
jgi:hypothetical protein